MVRKESVLIFPNFILPILSSIHLIDYGEQVEQNDILLHYQSHIGLEYTIRKVSLFPHIFG